MQICWGREGNRIKLEHDETAGHSRAQQPQAALPWHLEAKVSRDPY